MYRNVFIGTTAHAPQYWDAALVKYLNSRGIGKVLWGSDWPVVEPGRSRREVEELNLKSGALRTLLRDVAIDVFKLDLPKTSSDNS